MCLAEVCIISNPGSHKYIWDLLLLPLLSLCIPCRQAYAFPFRAFVSVLLIGNISRYMLSTPSLSQLAQLFLSQAFRRNLGFGSMAFSLLA